jgi:predicted transcriptional regulator
MATSAVIGVAVNPHAFRSSVVSMLATRGASDQTMRQAANLMNQSQQIQRSHYIKMNRTAASINVNQFIDDQFE